MKQFAFWFLFFIMSFAGVYMFTGLNIGDYMIKYTLVGGSPVKFQEVIYDYSRCLHFSIVTFSTVGYGNITPFGWSNLISAVQIILGVIIVALLTSVVVKKFIR